MDDTYETGLKIRKEVMGEAHVQRSLGDVDDFNRDIQEMVTSIGWGQVWARPGLTRRERSLINLAMLTALNRPREFQHHLLGALNNGCTKEQIREVLIQTAAYCGFPAALEGFRNAREVFKAHPEHK
jgi:4-carboxymuconolactone decarboxylase